MTLSMVAHHQHVSSWCPDDSGCKKMVRVLFPLIFDATTEYIADYVSTESRKKKHVPERVQSKGLLESVLGPEQ